VGPGIRALWGPDGLVCFTAGTSTATTGAWPSPTITASACQGSDKAMMAPPGFLEQAVMQGKVRRVELAARRHDPTGSRAGAGFG
jgi:hypothetical protein